MGLRIKRAVLAPENNPSFEKSRTRDSQIIPRFPSRQRIEAMVMGTIFWSAPRKGFIALQASFNVAPEPV